MRRLARVAVAAGTQQALPSAGLATKAAGSTLPQVAPVVHPPQQSVRPGALPGDRTHTDKWLQGTHLKVPIEAIAAVSPVSVHGNVAKCYGGTEPSLGHPVEYIVLNDTSEEFPATCKYCGLRYFHSHGHH